MVSNKGIQVDPLKVEAIVNFPPPHSIKKLQSLQGKCVDVIVTLECVHLYFLTIVTQCSFRDVL